MADVIKDLLIKNGKKDKFLTIDDRGAIVPSNIGSAEITEMANNIIILQNKTQQATEKVVDINGEQVQ